MWVSRVGVRGGQMVIVGARGLGTGSKYRDGCVTFSERARARQLNIAVFAFIDFAALL